MTYNWEFKDWPIFRYDLTDVEDSLIEIAERVGRTSGLMTGLPDNAQEEALIDMMVAEAIKTSEIEGEYISRKDVMSSIRNNLGFNATPEQISDKRAEGAAELMIDVRNSYKSNISEAVLFSWHEMIMRGSQRVKVGEWRNHEEPMQVISGLIGKEKVHYEAPPSALVAKEMKAFIQWFNNTAPGAKDEIKKPAVRSAIAHLYFETIHPFEDGNGRIGRAISEKALSQGVGRAILLSLSRSIEANKNAYYDALQTAQSSNEITPWINYFVNLVLESQIQAEEQIDFTLKKTKFFDLYESLMNDRQLRVVKRMLENGLHGFEGKMSAKKYIKMTKTSKPTATRDLQDLVERAYSYQLGGGRSTRYEVSL